MLHNTFSKHKIVTSPKKVSYLHPYHPVIITPLQLATFLPNMAVMERSDCI